MAYSKLPKACQDYPLGLQDINQAIDNNVALRDLYDAKHGIKEASARSGNLWALAGVHDDVHVARTICRVTVATSGTVVTPALQVSGLAVSSVSRIGTGQYLFPVNGLASWWAVVQAEGTTTQRRAICYRVQPSSGQHLLYVTAYALDAGAFVATDYDFGVVVFGTPP